MSETIRGPGETRLTILSFRHVLIFITSAEIKPYAHSDHDCICMTLDFDKIQRGPGFWHFNNELLTDALFQEEIKQFWNGLARETYGFS